MSGGDQIAKMTIPARLQAAKEKTRRVVDHLLYVLELHENNAVVFYSPMLSKQIPTSFAANAFNIFRRGLYQIEIVRLCALWDGAQPEKENIPTIVELIDHPQIIDALIAEAAAPWDETGRYILNPSSDPRVHELQTEELEESNALFGREQAEKARHALSEAIANTYEILASPLLQGIMNLRDKHLAHSLTQTRREKSHPIRPMKYGHERELLEESIPIVEALYCWINGTSFSFKVVGLIAKTQSPFGKPARLTLDHKAARSLRRTERSRVL